MPGLESIRTEESRTDVSVYRRRKSMNEVWVDLVRDPEVAITLVAAPGTLHSLDGGAIS